MKTNLKPKWRLATAWEKKLVTSSKINLPTERILDRESIRTSISNPSQEDLRYPSTAIQNLPKLIVSHPASKILNNRLVLFHIYKETIWAAGASTFFHIEQGEEQDHSITKQGKPSQTWFLRIKRSCQGQEATTKGHNLEFTGNSEMQGWRQQSADKDKYNFKYTDCN